MKKKRKIKGWICPNCFSIMYNSDLECTGCKQSVNPHRSFTQASTGHKQALPKSK